MGRGCGANPPRSILSTTHRHSRESGNPGRPVPGAHRLRLLPSPPPHPLRRPAQPPPPPQPPPSFPRKRESRDVPERWPSHITPALHLPTLSVVPPNHRHPRNLLRHSRESGNPGMPVPGAHRLRLLPSPPPHPLRRPAQPPSPPQPPRHSRESGNPGMGRGCGANPHHARPPPPHPFRRPAQPPSPPQPPPSFPRKRESRDGPGMRGHLPISCESFNPVNPDSDTPTATNPLPTPTNHRTIVLCVFEHTFPSKSRVKALSIYNHSQPNLRHSRESGNPGMPVPGAHRLRLLPSPPPHPLRRPAQPPSPPQPPPSFPRKRESRDVPERWPSHITPALHLPTLSVVPPNHRHPRNLLVIPAKAGIQGWAGDAGPTSPLTRTF